MEDLRPGAAGADPGDELDALGGRVDRLGAGLDAVDAALAADPTVGSVADPVLLPRPPAAAPPAGRAKPDNMVLLGRIPPWMRLLLALTIAAAAFTVWRITA